MDHQYYLIQFNSDRVSSNLNPVSTQDDDFLTYLRVLTSYDLQIVNEVRTEQGLSTWSLDDEDFIAYFHSLTNSRRLERISPVELSRSDRHQKVIELHSQGMKLQRICEKLNVSRKTIQRDMLLLDLHSFSPLTDDELQHELQTLIDSQHSYIGYRNIEGGLVARGFRVQRRRIMDMMV